MTEAKKLAKLIAKAFDVSPEVQQWWNELGKAKQADVKDCIERTLDDTIPENPSVKKP